MDHPPPSSADFGTNIQFAGSGYCPPGYGPGNFLTLWARSPNGSWTYRVVGNGNGTYVSSGLQNYQLNDPSGNTWTFELTVSPNPGGTSPSGTIVAGPSSTVISAWSLPLNADTSTDSIIMAGYWMEYASDGYINQVAGQSPLTFTILNTDRADEDAVLGLGNDPSFALPFEHGTVYGVPSLYASIPGAGIFSATSGFPATPYGYKSENPQAIDYHVRLLSCAGVQVLLLDFTNNTAMQFASPLTYNENTQNPQPGMASDYETLLKELATLARAGQHIHVVPMIGAECAEDLGFAPQAGKTVSADPNNIITGPNQQPGPSPFQNALAFFLAGLKAHPELQVIYKARPLICFFGMPKPVPQVPSQQQLLATADYQSNAVQYSQYTSRNILGFIDTQSLFWSASQSLPPYKEALSANGSPLWSWEDHYCNYDPKVDGFMSYALDRSQSPAVPEFVVADLISPSNDGSLHSLNTPLLTIRGGEQINACFSEATLLAAHFGRQPRFIMIPEFNQFINEDCGFDPAARQSWEPTMLASSSTDGLNATMVDTSQFLTVMNAIQSYRATIDVAHRN